MTTTLGFQADTHTNLGTPRLYVDGRWQEAPFSLPILNPSTGSLLTHVARCKEPEVDQAVAAARHCLQNQVGSWGSFSATERGRVLMRMSELTKACTDELAHLEALDVGKPLRQGRADALALARYLEFYAGAADKVMGQTLPMAHGYSALTWREPHGVTAHIVPWNYPMQILGRSVGAALAMGNACVVKPAELACLTALAFAQIAHEAGLPAGALNLLPGLGEEAGACLAAHAGVNHLSFTGSVMTGQKIAAAAARNVTPCTLELGGKSPQIVFADADLDAALPFLVNAGIQNAGQTCSAASRILVHKPVFSEVANRMSARYRELRVGPAANDLELGPVVSQSQKERVEAYLRLAEQDGLPLLAQGCIVDAASKTGFFLRPSLFGPVPAWHALAQEEIFGPVQVLIEFEDEQEAIDIANGTAFGLVAGVWSRDGARQLRMARSLQCGQVFINNYGAAGGVELPFGGVKHSGYGREKGMEALYGFSQLKTVAIYHG